MIDTSRAAIERWLLLDDCRLPPRVFTIIHALLDEVDRRDEQLRQCDAGRAPGALVDRDADRGDSP